MKNRPIQLGVVGCGWIMRSAYTPTLLSLSEAARVAAVCDLNKAAAHSCASHFPDAVVFNDLREMLREAKLDGVIVLTSEKVNAAVAQAVLQVNLPVYLEKPPAISSPQLEDLIAAEKRSKTFVFAAFNRRHTPLFAGLDFKGEKPVRVSGALRRKNRVVATFPHTSIHLIDSAQYFGHSLFHHWKIAFERNHDHSIWTVSAKMEKRRRLSSGIGP